MSSSDELAALRQENDLLRSRLISAGLMPRPTDLPSDTQVTALLAMVEARHPALRPGRDETKETHRRAFVNALNYLSFAFRRDSLNTQYAASFFADECEEWLRRFDIKGGVTLRSFCAGCVASNVMTTSFGNFPYGVSLGLNSGYDNVARCYWRAVVRDGLSPPVESASKRPVQTFEMNLARR